MIADEDTVVELVAAFVERTRDDSQSSPYSVRLVGIAQDAREPLELESAARCKTFDETKILVNVWRDMYAPIIVVDAQDAH